MVGRGAVACLLAVACASGPAQPPARALGSGDMRCTLRISERGTFVDGTPMSHTDAVGMCKRVGSAIVVIEDSVPCSEWVPIRSALRQEGVAIYLRGPVGDFRQPVFASNAPPVKPSRVASPRCLEDNGDE